VALIPAKAMCQGQTGLTGLALAGARRVNNPDVSQTCKFNVPLLAAGVLANLKRLEYSRAGGEQ